MNRAERDRRHRRNLERINQVQLVVGRGDKARIDHEATLIERARLMVEEVRSHEATEQGLQAFDRLLRVAEEGQSRQARWVGEFITAVWEDRPVKLSMLRGLGSGIGDDVIAVLDGLRYARLDLVEHVQGGPRRVTRLIERLQPSPATT